MEDALRSNLTQALSSKFDNILLNDSTAGLLGGGLTAPNDPSSVVDWPGYKGLLTNQVDGHYASMPDQVRMLIGSKTYTHMETLYRVLAANGGVNESSYELLVRKSGGVRISSPWQNLDFSGLCSFRTLALRWPNDGFQERKTANRAGTTPRNAPKGDSWLSSAPLGSK